MCFGGNQAPAIQQPQVVYRGPSEDDIRRQEEGLATFQQQMTDQSNAFNAQLQEQIEAANKDYEDLETRFSSEIATLGEESNASINTAQTAANTATATAQANKEAAVEQGIAEVTAAQTAGLFEQAGAYQVATTESDPVNTQETAAITKKKKKDNGLKISPNAQAAAAGTGLNIGV